MRFGILGPLSVRDGDRAIVVGAAKQRTILAALLLRPNLPRSADELIELVWGEDRPPAARDTLRSYVMRLRRTLAPASDRLRTQAPGYLIEVRPGELDSERLTALVDEAGTQVDRDWAAVGRLAAEALALWQEPLLDVSCPALHRDEVPWLRRVHWQAVELWADASLHLDEYDQLIRHVPALLADDPLRETLSGHLMLALARTGRQAEALTVFGATRDRLVEELGIEPGPALQAVHQQVLRGDSRPPRPVPAQLPADLSDFTGRTAELAWVLDALGHRDTTAVVVVSGPGGIGKTAVAVHAAHLARSGFPDGVLHADLRGSRHRAPGPDRVLGRFLRDLGTAPECIPVDTEERTALYRSACGGARLLVVLDDAESAEQVRPLLPGDPGCAVVVTSRHSLADLPGADRVDLQALPADDAVDLLAAFLGTDPVLADRAASGRVVAACAGLPLALRVVAGRMAARQWDMRTLAGRLVDPGRRLDEMRVGALAVRDAFALGYDNLRPPDTAGVDRRWAFRTLAAADGPPLGVPAAAAMLDCDERAAEAALDDLVDARLLTEPRPGRYGYHDLLRAYALELRPEPGPEPPRRLLRWYCHATVAAGAVISPQRPSVPLADSVPARPPPAFDTGEDALAWLDGEYPNLLAGCAQAADAGEDALGWALPTALWSYFDLRKLWDDWIATHATARLCADRLGDRPAAARVRNNLAIALLQLRRLDEAREHLLASLRLRRELGDANGEAAVLTNLASAHHQAGAVEEARDVLLRAVELRRKLGNEVGLALALADLGIVQRALGELTGSTAAGLEALDLSARHGMTQVEGAVTRGLAENDRIAGDLAGAEARCRRALELAERGGDDYERAHDLVVLAEVLRDAGRVEPARAAVAEAVELFAALAVPDEQDARALLAELT